MSRDDGFAIADLDTGLLEDPKVKALWRLLGPDEGRMGHALTLYLAVILASWRHGARVTVHEAAPVWLTVDTPLVEALVNAKLLDGTGRLRVTSWRRWFGPAQDRREQRRAAGRKGGQRSWDKRRSSDPISDAEPGRPTGRPSVRTVRQDRPPGARVRGGAPARLGDVMRDVGGFAAQLAEEKKP